MGNVYKMALRFKNKYPMTVAWRIRKNASVIERHLNPGEEVLYVFAAQKNDNPFDIVSTAVIALTNKRILIGRKRVVFGYFLDSITPDLFNDLKIKSGILWGKAYIDTLNELDTTGIEPMSHVFPVNNVFREDVVTNGDGREETLANAPQRKEDSFEVPRTIG